MARPQPETSPDEAPGTPAWMVTFSDCMNLLLTFFVLLVTFSSFGEDRRQAILIFGAAIRTIFGQVPEEAAKTGGGQDASSMATQYQIQLAAQPEHGSDKPTGEEGSSDTGGVLQDDVQTADYHNHKLFLIASRKVFLGKGVLLSAEGRYLLAVMAAFLENVPGRVILSENGPDRQDGAGVPDASREIGWARAWAVLEFFVQAQNLEPQRFSISADTTMPRTDTPGQTARGIEGERRLEIVLLDRGGPR